MQNKRLVLFFFLVIVVVLSGCVSTKKLSDVFAPVPTPNSVAGVGHTINEIIDISNAEVKKAVYADYLTVGPGPTVVSGRDLWKQPVLVPLFDPIADCNAMCDTFSMDCFNVFYTTGAGWSGVDNGWQLGGESFCDDSVGSDFKLPLCSCKSKTINVAEGSYDITPQTVTKDEAIKDAANFAKNTFKGIDGTECTKNSDCLSSTCNQNGVCISDDNWIGNCGSVLSQQGGWGCSSDKTKCKNNVGQEKKCATSYSCKLSNTGISVGCQK